MLSCYMDKQEVRERAVTDRWETRRKRTDRQMGDETKTNGQMKRTGRQAGGRNERTDGQTDTPCGEPV